MSTLSTTLSAVFTGSISALIAGSLWIGRDYYLLPRLERPGHELHGLLSPGGGLGVLLGLVGAGLMVAMLVYTLRKLVVRARWLGPTSAWLQFHIVCGIGGPACILLHGGVAVWPRGLVAVGFWCMVAVALSGAFGRYVYGLLPRATGGRELAFDAARARLADLRETIVSDTTQEDPAALAEAVAVVASFEREVHSLSGLIGLQAELRDRRRRVRGLLDSTGLPPEIAGRVRTALEEQLRLKRGLEASRVGHRLFRYWHLFHRPLAGAMYVIVALHVASAVLFGGSLAQLAGL